jgi:hypothetical protein
MPRERGGLGAAKSSINFYSIHQDNRGTISHSHTQFLVKFRTESLDILLFRLLHLDLIS